MLRAAGIAGQVERGDECLLVRFWYAGFANMNGVIVATLHSNSQADLTGQDIANGFPTVVDAFGLQTQTNGMNDIISQNADEQMTFHPFVDLMINRTQAKIGFE